MARQIHANFSVFLTQYYSEGHIKAIYRHKDAFLVMRRNYIERRLVNDGPSPYIFFFISVTARFLDCVFGILKTKCASKTREKTLSDGFKQISVRQFV